MSKQIIMKKILFLFFSFFLISFSFASDNDYLDYAEIKDTDVINMNGNFNWNIYRVYISTWDIFYVTWSDNKIHNCFAIMGTWYTEKLWEIYFQYEWKGSYVCDDYKLRWVFKIWAWWWWYMEDLENNPEKWKNYLDKIDTDGKYYHSATKNWTWKWKARIDGIWFSTWDTVSTKMKLSSYFSKITVSSSIAWNARADGESKLNFYISLKYNWKKLKNFTVDKIYFVSWYNSDILENWKKISPFKYYGPKTTNENGFIIWHITSLNGNKNLKYGLVVKIWENLIKYKWNTSNFTYPFDINFSIKNDKKLLIWYTNQAKLTKSVHNISDLSFQNLKTKLQTNNIDYFSINQWDNIAIDWNYHKIKISYKDFLKNDQTDIFYRVNWDYSFEKNWKYYTVSSFNYSTNSKSLYKDGKIYSINITEKNSNVSADGKSKKIYQIKFYDKNGYRINHLNFDLNIEDVDKKFNLSNDGTYETWFFISKDFDLNNWIYNVAIISYKPVKKAKLSFNIKNIFYNWHYTFNNPNFEKYIDDVNFLPVIESIFSNNILKINKEDKIKYDIENDLWTSISNLSYTFTGYIKNAPSAVFYKWKIVKWNNFWDKNIDVYIQSDECPSAVIYSWYYSYDLDGLYWQKRVFVKQQKEYSPVLFIQSSKIKIVWWILTNKKILQWLNYVATSINPYKFRNYLKKQQYKKYVIWQDFQIVSTNLDLPLSSLTKNIYVYKCENGETISLYGTYDHSIKFYTLWCKINIKSDIKSNKWKLEIYAFSNENIDFNDINGWDVAWNIYIKSNVKTIVANIFTEWSIFSYKNNISANNIFVDNRVNDNNFKYQLFIKWKIFAKNTIWWGNRLSDGTYTIVNGKTLKNVSLFWYSLKSVAQAYDLSFLKSNYVKSDGTYDTWSLSDYIYNKYHCTWNKDIDNKNCTTTILIEN